MAASSRLARLSHDEGMRAIVIKNHQEPNVALADLARKAVAGMTVFGGIALNLATGGIIPHAVEWLSMMPATASAAGNRDHDSSGRGAVVDSGERRRPAGQPGGFKILC